MASLDTQPDGPALRAGLRRLYRDFLDRAEKKRRWLLRPPVPLRMDFARTAAHDLAYKTPALFLRKSDLCS